MLGSGCGKHRYDRGRTDFECHARNQLLGQLAEERLAKRGESDDKGDDVATKEVILDGDLDYVHSGTPRSNVGNALAWLHCSITKAIACPNYATQV